MNPARPPLAESLDHPLYEMQMLLRTAQELPKYERGTVAANALLESFVVHARCLDEFFRKRGDGRNINAWDFIAWEKAPGHPKTEKMNREVLHLGWTRKRPGTDGEEWNALEVIRELAPAATKFLEAVAQRQDLMDFPTAADRERIPALRERPTNAALVRGLLEQLLRYRESAWLVETLRRQPYLASSSATASVTYTPTGPYRGDTINDSGIVST